MEVSSLEKKIKFEDVKIKKFYNDLYFIDFIFVLSKSKKDVLKKFGLTWNKVGGCTKYKGKILIIMNPESTLDTLVHECDHAVSYAWKKRSISLCKQPDECHAYMLAWVFSQCYDFLLAKGHRFDKA